MSKILRQNVGGVDFTMAGCALTGVCPTAVADYVKQITLSDGDVIEDGMMMVVTFANGNSAGNAPNTKTIYSSDQVDYFEDDQLTIPFTLAPEGCYEIEYTGTANAYTYTDYPVFQVGSVRGPVCDYRGHIASGDLWNAGDSVQCMLKEGKFLLLGGSGGADIDVYDSMAELIADLPNLQEGQFAATKDTGDELSQPVDVVEEGNMHAVTSNAVASLIKDFVALSETGKTSYTCPKTGIYTIRVDCYFTTNGFDDLKINGNIIGGFASPYSTTSGHAYSTLQLFLKKGDILSITNSSGSSKFNVVGIYEFDIISNQGA